MEVYVLCNYSFPEFKRLVNDEYFELNIIKGYDINPSNRIAVFLLDT